MKTRDQRKAELAEATWTIILTRGLSAVSVRSVAAEAKMSVGSLRHLFPTQAGLLQFSAELMIAQTTERIRNLAPVADPIEAGLAFLAQVIPLDAQRRREFEINMALIAETPANPGLAAIRDHTHELLLGLCERIVVSLRGDLPPSEPVELSARRLLALTDGLGLHLLHQPPGSDTTWATDILRAELVRIRA